jgi:hypothetical protein
MTTRDDATIEAALYDQVIEKTIALSRFLVENHIKHPDTELTANLGEWYVMAALIRQGHSPRPHSGQYPCDIVLQDKTRIEVKSGTPEKPGLYRFADIEPSKHDFLVCVLYVDDDYASPRLHILDGDDVEALPPNNHSKFDDPEEDYNVREIYYYEDENQPRAKKWQRLSHLFPEYKEKWEKLPKPPSRD